MRLIYVACNIATFACNLYSAPLKVKKDNIMTAETKYDYDDENIFARILRGEIPNDTVYEDEYVLAFNDIFPKSPVHILVIPKNKYTSIDDFGTNASEAESKAFYAAIAKITKDKGLDKSGFRCIVNTGADGGQEVPHFHMHILGGKNIGPMVTEK